MNQNQDGYNNLGIASSSLKAVQLNAIKEDKIFEKYYEVGGLSGVSEDDIKNYFNTEYARAKIISFSLGDSEGNALDDDAKAEMLEVANGYLERAKNGEDFDALIEEYEASLKLKMVLRRLMIRPLLALGKTPKILKIQKIPTANRLRIQAKKQRTTQKAPKALKTRKILRTQKIQKTQRILTGAETMRRQTKRKTLIRMRICIRQTANILQPSLSIIFSTPQMKTSDSSSG